jgi:hypothetical protein
MLLLALPADSKQQHNGDMLAKLHLQLPFELTLPDAVEFKLYSFESSEYRVQFEVPIRSGKPPVVEHVTLNEKPAFQADLLTITFRKESFNRTAAPPEADPPEEFIQSVLDYFFGRLRYATNAFHVKSLNFSRCQSVLEYLNDDGSALPEDPQKKLIRRRIATKSSVSLVACDADVWDYIFSLPADFEPPAWHTLLLDSRAALPHVGTAVVLAATALEVFIAELLDVLAKGWPVPNMLWDWIKKRGNDIDKQPSVEEQFDALLMVMTGHSLKEERALWDSFQNLKTSRNKFVHEGIPRIGKNTPPVTEADALAFIGQAEAIVAKTREWIPEKLRWPVYVPKSKLGFMMPFTMPFAVQPKNEPPVNTPPVARD